MAIWPNKNILYCIQTHTHSGTLLHISSMLYNLHIIIINIKLLLYDNNFNGEGA